MNSKLPEQVGGSWQPMLYEGISLVFLQMWPRFQIEMAENNIFSNSLAKFPFTDLSGSETTK